MTEIKETKSCENCGKCIICGWRTGRKVHTISYYCDELDRHVSPWDGARCMFHEPGDPWNTVKEKERRARDEQGGNAGGVRAAEGEKVLVICKTVEASSDAFYRMKEFLDDMGLPYKARDYDKQVKLSNGAFVKFGAKYHDKHSRPHKGGFTGAVVWSE